MKRACGGVGGAGCVHGGVGWRLGEKCTSRALVWSGGGGLHVLIH